MELQEATEVVEGLMYRCRSLAETCLTSRELLALRVVNLVCVKLYQDRSIWLCEANSYVNRIQKEHP